MTDNFNDISLTDREQILSTLPKDCRHVYEVYNLDIDCAQKGQVEEPIPKNLSNYLDVFYSNDFGSWGYYAVYILRDHKGFYYACNFSDRSAAIMGDSPPEFTYKICTTFEEALKHL